MENIYTNNLLKGRLYIIVLFSLVCFISSSSRLFAQTGPNDDFDGDGIVNSLDADDDNDGVPDVLESPLCYVSKEAMVSFSRVGAIQVSSDLTRVAGYSDLNNLIDGGGTYIVYTSSISIVDKTIMGFNFGNPLKIDTLTLKTNTTTNFVNGTYKVQGSNDGSNWTDLTAAVAPIPTVYVDNYGEGAWSIRIPFTQNTGNYSYYRVRGVSGTILTGGNSLYEARFSISSYNQHYFTFSGCSKPDDDSDGFPNELDLDSDNDGCYDSFESGAAASNVSIVSGPYGANGLANSLESAPESGTINYNSTYIYAKSTSLVYCTDSDGDGVVDILDLDDDNDGILDTRESQSDKIISLKLGPSSGFSRSTAIGTTSQGWTMTYGNIDIYNPCNVNQDGGDGIDGGSLNFGLRRKIPTTPGRVYQFLYTSTRHALKNVSVGRVRALSGTNTQKILAENLRLHRTSDVECPFFETLSFVANSDSTVIEVASVSGIYGYPGDSTGYGSVYGTFRYRQIGNYDDTDNDGIPNTLDLDSDGDGCYDKYEASVPGATKTGAVTDSLAATSSAQVGANGLANTLETNDTQNANTNYLSDWAAMGLNNKINACSDFDNDGIGDAIDIDDDNDGTIDWMESTSCFSTAKDYQYSSLKKKYVYNISTQITTDVLVEDMVTPLTNGDLATKAFNLKYFVDVTNKDVLRIDFNTAMDLSNIYVKYIANTYTMFNNAVIKIQGSVDGITWTDLSPQLTYAYNTFQTNPLDSTTVGTQYNNDFPITLNKGKYMSYRLYGVSGTSHYGQVTELFFGFNSFNRSMYPISDCVASVGDTDGDGQANWMDLDSDGDGCSDAKEAGATTSSTTNFQFTGAVGTNGLVNTLETAVDNGVINYNSTYSTYGTIKALNVCGDFDNDGIGDLVDIDDDNDGILDIVELMPCALSLNTTSSKSAIIITSDFTPASGTIQTLLDNSENNGMYFTANTDITNKTIFSYQLANMYSVSGFEISTNGSSFFNTGATYKIQASNDGISWTDLTTTQTAVTGTLTAGVYSGVSSTYKFQFTNYNPYKYYRVLGLSGSLSGGPWLRESSFSIAIPVICDTDNDGANNNLDLDSDGDGCSDALEGGATSITTANYQFTGAVGTNGLVNSLETTVDNGVINYTSLPYAYVKGLALCSDTDNDGLGDMLDIDDDNDGVLDVTELASCAVSLNTSTAKNTIGITSSATIATGTVSSLLDDTIANTFYFSGSDITNKAIATFTLPTFYTLTGFEFATNGSSFITTGATYKIQGSLDGSNWVDLTSTITASSASLTSGIYSSAATTNKFSFTNSTAYKYYRIFGLSGTLSSGPYVQEVYFSQATPIFCDTDNDGVNNTLDLDSDGDGCSDAYEAGATTDKTANFKFIGAMGSNGFANSLETSTDNGIINYTYQPYAFNAALNACTDTDNDGIGDLVDIDDDNDGVLDIVECSNGLNSSTIVYNPGSIRYFDSNGNKILNCDLYPFTASGVYEFTCNGVNSANTYGNSYLIQANGVPVLQSGTDNCSINQSGMVYKAKENITVLPNTQYTFSVNLSWWNYAPPSLRFKINGVFYTPSNPSGPSSAGQVATVAINWNSGVASQITSFEIYNDQTAGCGNDFYFTLPIGYTGNYAEALENSSASPQNCDLDNDGVPNTLDLDSDGDGCPDTIESGLSTNLVSASVVNISGTSILSNAKVDGIVGINGLANTLETNDSYTALTNYRSTYGLYALSKTLNACLDTDSDGVKDLVDIDNDNDGIIDSIESPSCYFTKSEASVLNKVSTGLDYSGALIENVIDGRSSTYLSFNPSQSIVNKSIFKVRFAAPVQLSMLKDSLNTSAHILTLGSTYRLEGSNDGIVWDAVSTTQTAGALSSSVFVISSNSTSSYLYYRIWGISGSTSSSTVQSLEIIPVLSSSYRASENPKTSCTQDLDNDGTSNDLDLDSDGDGCSDAKESGATTVGTSNYIFTGAVGSNGLVNSLETSVDNGVINYTYQPYAYSSTLNACADTDNDGVGDLIDIDDDNDGVLDITELASCALSLNTTSSKSSMIITSDFTPASGTVQTLLDNSENNGMYFTANADITNKTIFNYQLANMYSLTGFEISTNGNSFFNTGATYKIQASNDGISWTDLTTSQTAVTGTLTAGVYSGVTYTYKFQFTNYNPYKYYRVLGLSGSLSGGPWLRESSFSVAIPLICDTDNDGSNNNLDLDSDGDGCSDAYEAGATTIKTANYQFTGAVGSNGLVNNLETTVDNGMINYNSTYLTYAQSLALNLCSDFDNDGIGDIVDIDDDNDGILDAMESPTCFYTLTEASQIQSISSELSPYSTNTPNLAIDGNISTYSAFSPSINWVGKELFKVSTLSSFPLASMTLDLSTWALSSSVSNTFKLQGSVDNSSWVDLSLELSSTATSGTYTITNTLMPSGNFSYFRLLGVSGVSYYGGVTELKLIPNTSLYQSSSHPKSVCSSDKDGDGIPNQLDLDSDGDGCSDALEGGATTNTTANYQFTGAVGVNGLVNSLETVADNGVVNYNSTYTLYGLDATLNVCADSDNDGISDLVDIDDDNDGILDATESPSCFYTVSEISQIQTVSSELASYSTYVPSNTIDQSSSTLNAFTPSVNWVGKELYKVSTLGSFPLVSMSLDLSTWAISSSASNTFKLQGSNDNSSWTDLSGAVASTATTGTFVITNSLAPAGLFKYYRLIGVAGTSYYGGVSEIKLNVATTYNPSSYPKGGCTADVDGDGKLNHLDLDSDGDGCSDAKEGGATTSNTANYQFTGAVGVNGLVNSLETSADNGVINYSSTYTQYALVSSINACADTDNDGIADIVDIDDDNDGVLDTTEDCDASSSTTNQLNTSAKFTSAPTAVSGDSQIGYSYTPTGISFNPGGTVGQHNGVALLGPFTSTGVAVAVSAIVRKDWDVPSYGGIVKGLFEILNSSQTVVGSLSWENSTATGSTDANNQTITLSGVVPSGNYYIRIKDNGSTSTSNGWGDDWAVKELTISTQKCNWDLDNDGVPNRLDLDSDGDGCSDAYESGATVSVVPNYQFTGAVGANGLVNSLETSIDNGVLNYTSTYNNALNNSIHTCPSCVAGTVAPVLSSTTKVGVCPSTTIDLTSITASNLPAGTLLTWHTGSSASGANKVSNPSAVAGGTYYASFFDSANNCYSPTSALTATAASCATGVIDCSKTQLYPAPVVGVAGQKVLYVTLNVSTVGCFSPLIVSGSGFSVANGVTQICTSATGVQQMSIPVYYNGSSLGTMSFTVGTSGSCSADLTTTPKKAVVDMWTIECLPTQGPVLR